MSRSNSLVLETSVPGASFPSWCFRLDSENTAVEIVQWSKCYWIIISYEGEEIWRLVQPRPFSVFGCVRLACRQLRLMGIIL